MQFKQECQLPCKEKVMITIIFGAPGAGKSSLNTYFLKELYKTQGRSLLNATRRHIERANETRLNPVSFPDKPPIFSDYKVKFKVGYEKYFEPYFINGYFAGLPNDRMQMQFVPPGAKIFLSEVQRYYDSRKSQSMPDFVSRTYEMHRHYDLDFWLDVQRASLVDLNIRELCRRFLEVVAMQHTKDFAGRITQTVFTCREFDCWRDVAQYLETGAKTYKVVKFVNEGDIFRCFDSFNYFNEFLPDEGNDFKYLPFLSRFEAKNSTNSIYYDLSEPKLYRHEVGSSNKKKKEVA